MSRDLLIESAPGPAPIALSRRVRPSALWTLLRMSVEQLARGRRLLVLGLLFALPAAFALLARRYNPDYDAGQVELGLIFYMIPNALVPLTALVLASGMIRDEVEDQTLTYLLIRPLPRWSIYLAKLLAVLLIASALEAVFTSTALAAIHWGADDFWGTILPGRALRVSALSALSLWAYVALFGCLSLFVRWTLPLGVAYIVLFEGLFANIDFVVRRLTVIWYARVLAERWLGLHVPDWSIDLDAAPSGRECLLTLLIAGSAFAAVAAWSFGVREFRVKTPEGS